MTTFNLRHVKLHAAEQLRTELEVELDGLVLGGQEYLPAPALAASELLITKTTTGSVFELSFGVRLRGPCFRCLADTELELPIHAREYHATDPGADEELRSPYVADDVLDLSAWARDSLALALPEKILCRPDCAGLCPACGKDLNVEPHEHEETGSDSRWSALEALRNSE
ncbi:MAG TPA: DUF177 domain-containing protein [Gaiellaceae bacterium]